MKNYRLKPPKQPLKLRQNTVIKLQVRTSNRIATNITNVYWFSYKLYSILWLTFYEYFPFPVFQISVDQSDAEFGVYVFNRITTLM